MTNKELKDLEGKRIRFCFKNEGMYCKYEGKIKVEDVKVNIVKDNQVVQQMRQNMILTDCSINNVHVSTPQKFSFKKVREITNYKVIFDD